MTEDGEPSSAQRLLGDFAPALVGFTDDVLFGEVWKRTHLAFYAGWPKAMAAMIVAKRVFRGDTNERR
jgi:4-carboxymuconolactone decarboxylase